MKKTEEKFLNTSMESKNNCGNPSCACTTCNCGDSCPESGCACGCSCCL